MYIPTEEELIKIKNFQTEYQVFGDDKHVCGLNCDSYDIINNLWICKNTGNVHHCTTETCNFKMYCKENVICSFSQKVYNTLFFFDPRVIGADANTSVQFQNYYPGYDMIRTAKKNNEELYDTSLWTEDVRKMRQSMEIVRVLFFSEARRDHHNGNKVVIDVEMNRFYRDYVARRVNNDHKYIHLYDLYVYKLNLIRNYKLKSIIKMDEHIIEYYSNIILHMWKILLFTKHENSYNSDIKISFSAFAISVIYLLKVGIPCGAQNLYEKEDFIIKHAPSEHDLNIYNFETQNITQGQNLLLRIINFLKSAGYTYNFIENLKYKKLGEYSKSA
jgi:hypothetical protein